jgi:hypothetical protein
MTRCLFGVLLLLIAVEFETVPLLTAKDTACTIDAYGQTGEDLPPLIKTALEALSGVSLDGLPRMAIDTQQVVVLTGLDKFASCQGFSDLGQMNWVRKNARMFTLGAQYPIYISGFRQDFAGALRAYGHGHVYTRYLYAAWIGHEWAHAQFREEAELLPYETELRLELYFAAKGLLPPEPDNPYIRATRRQLAAASAAAKANHPMTGPLIILRQFAPLSLPQFSQSEVAK